MRERKVSLTDALVIGIVMMVIAFALGALATYNLFDTPVAADTGAEVVVAYPGAWKGLEFVCGLPASVDVEEEVVLPYITPGPGGDTSVVVATPEPGDDDPGTDDDDPVITPTPIPPTPTPEPEEEHPSQSQNNCGVGNGVDGDTPGCPNGRNDGEGTSPGAPGSQNGNGNGWGRGGRP